MYIFNPSVQYFLSYHEEDHIVVTLIIYRYMLKQSKTVTQLLPINSVLLMVQIYYLTQVCCFCSTMVKLHPLLLFFFRAKQDSYTKAEWIY